MRGTPRFVHPDEVEIKVGDARSNVWVFDISRGGLFLCTDRPPEVGTELSVTLQGELELSLKAKVVHVLDEDAACRLLHPQGIGLEFTDLTDEDQASLDDYLSTLKECMGASGLPESVDDGSRRVAEAVGTFLSAIEDGDAYGAAGCTPRTDEQTLRQNISSLESLFTVKSPGLSPAEVALKRHALRMVRWLSRLMSSPIRRLELDLRAGYVTPEELLVGEPPVPMHGMRVAWARAFPDRMQESRDLLGRMEAFLVAGDIRGAHRCASAALKYDPFNPRMRTALTHLSKRMDRESDGPRVAEPIGEA